MWLPSRDFRAQKPTQVSFARGARIAVLGPAEDGFFRGRLEQSYEEGLFPEAMTVSEREWMKSSGGGGAGEKKGVEDEVVAVCKCLQDYVAKKTGELSFKEHDRVEVLERTSALVWRCRVKGKVGTVIPSMLEEDKGFTIRKAAASKQASREKFQNRRVKEKTSIETKKNASGSSDLGALKKEQEKLALERDRLLKEKEGEEGGEIEARQRVVWRPHETKVGPEEARSSRERGRNQRAAKSRQSKGRSRSMGRRGCISGEEKKEERSGPKKGERIKVERKKKKKKKEKKEGERCRDGF